ncbi:hypothetical protein A0H81_06985 [Grifola frondosa]|uniref:Uncharacterized protein n=1 Tax=Grifola frondosa TaxID=5627 RepID=A0A1C7MEJ5_GRIFR|nr:hypothetical protein A0H81_06985 [Grifola frondosa]
MIRAATVTMTPRTASDAITRPSKYIQCPPWRLHHLGRRLARANNASPLTVIINSSNITMSYLLTSPVFAWSDKDIQAEHHFGDSLYFSYGEDPASTSRHTQSPRVYRESALRMNGSPTFQDALISPSEPTDIYSVPHALSPIRTAHHLDFRSPSSFVDFYFSARDAKPITELSPGTPFQSLFVSSPNRYWEEVDLSVSPVCRHSPTVFHTGVVFRVVNKNELKKRSPFSTIGKPLKPQSLACIT